MTGVSHCAWPQILSLEGSPTSSTAVSPLMAEGTLQLGLREGPETGEEQDDLGPSVLTVAHERRREGGTQRAWKRLHWGCEGEDGAPSQGVQVPLDAEKGGNWLLAWSPQEDPALSTA